MTVNTKTYSERAETHASPVAQRLFRLMELKKTNLCASIDVDTTKEFLELIDKLGPYVCLIKTHIDIINDFSYESTIEPLLELSRKHQFMILKIENLLILVIP